VSSSNLLGLRHVEVQRARFVAVIERQVDLVGCTCDNSILAFSPASLSRWTAMLSLDRSTRIALEPGHNQSKEN